jgi:TetR/AcrR family transcriptional repressor of mexJK operon
MGSPATSRRPGRPAGSTPDEILAVAREVLLDAGYAGTTMEAIAKRAGVSKASLYQAFPSKDDLYRAVVTDWTGRGSAGMRPHVDALLAAINFPEALRELVGTIQAAILSPDVLAMRTLVTTTAERHPDTAIEYASRSWDRNIAMLAEAFAELHRRGVLVASDPEVAAQQLTWLAVGTALNVQQLTAGARTVSPEALGVIADAAVETFARAYRPAEGVMGNELTERTARAR